MPLLRIQNIDGYYSPKQIIECFKRETNIDLKIFLSGINISSSEIKIKKLWQKDIVLNKFRKHLDQINQSDFIIFRPDDPIEEVNEILEQQLGFDFEFYYENERISKKKRLNDFRNYPSDKEMLPMLYKINQKLIEITELIKIEREKSVQLFNELNHQVGNKYNTDFEPEYNVDFFIQKADPLYHPDDENIFFRHTSGSLLCLSAKKSYDAHEKEKNEDFSATDYWRLVSIEQNHPVLKPCKMFYAISQYALAPCDMVRIGEFWIDFHHVNQIFENENNH